MMQNENIKQAINKLKDKLIITFGSGIEIYLFGSVARGDYQLYSDIDILVLVPFKLNNTIEEQIIDTAYDIELEYGVVFGIVAYSKEYWYSQISQHTPLYKNVQREGITV